MKKEYLLDEGEAIGLPSDKGQFDLTDLFNCRFAQADFLPRANTPLGITKRQEAYDDPLDDDETSGLPPDEDPLDPTDMFSCHFEQATSLPRANTPLGGLKRQETLEVHLNVGEYSGLPPDKEQSVLTKMFNYQFKQSDSLPQANTPMGIPKRPPSGDKQMELIDLLWKAGVKESVPTKDLLKKASPIMEKQELAQAIDSLASIAINKLPLIVFERVLYYRESVVWKPINKMDLYQLLDSSLCDQNVMAGLNDRSITELYNKVLLRQSIKVEQADMACAPYLVAFEDGIYNVLTMKEQELSPDNFFFSCLNMSVKDIGKGDGKYFEAYANNMSGGDWRKRKRYLQSLGTMISGYRLKKIFLFLGPHDTGKTQGGNLLRLIIGEKAMFSITDPNELSDRWTFGCLPGKRLCYCPDASKIPLSQQTIAAIKQLTGGDLLRAERKYQDPFTFVNEANLLFVSNYPLCGHYDEALLSRLVVVPFQNSIEPSKQIPDLAQKLYAERGYIVGQALLALRELIQNNFEFTPVECESGFISGFSQTSDYIEDFFADCCEEIPDSCESTKALFDAYQSYCTENALTALTDSGVFGRQLSLKFPKLERTRNAGGSGVRGFFGIKLL